MPHLHLTELLIGLSNPSHRRETAGALARYLGAEHLFVLLPDPELGMHLPAQGFPQTLPRGGLWREFTAACLQADEYHRGELFFPTASDRHPALGLTASDKSVLILLGGSPRVESLRELRQLLPLLGASFRQEAASRIAISQTEMARRATSQARALVDALEVVRGDLQKAISSRDLALHAGQMGTWRWDAESKQAFWSSLQEELFDLSPGAYDGTEAMFLRLLHPDDRPVVQEAIARELQSHSGYRAQYRVQRSGDDLRWLAAQGNVVMDESGKLSGLTGVTWDITAQKQAEEALARQADEMARSNADLQQFAYVTSHDLQEPLRTIISFSQLIAQRYKGKLDADADQFLNFITESGHRMATLVEDLLSFSQVTNTERVAFSSVSLEQTLTWARLNLQDLLLDSEARIDAEPLPTILGNQVQLVQLFQNLIGNAIKYRSSRPLCITITARLEDAEWTIAVRDNGMGIEPKYHERIFGLFKRLHGRQIPGTGIGLSICKRIVQKHGGRIWVESEPGVGSAFIFTLPDLSTASPLAVGEGNDV